jgi:hypothetical protein
LAASHTWNPALDKGFTLLRPYPPEPREALRRLRQVRPDWRYTMTRVDPTDVPHQYHQERQKSRYLEIDDAFIASGHALVRLDLAWPEPPTHGQAPMARTSWLVVAFGESGRRSQPCGILKDYV